MKISTTKDKIWYYFILTARVLLAWTFFGYGYSKLSGNQFGISEVEMATTIKDLSLFKISWFVFEQEPFKTFVGISQIICAILLLINRTVLFGVLLFLPIVSTILIIDLTIMSAPMATAFAWRLGSYLILAFLILWHYRERMRVIIENLWVNVRTKQRFSIWIYLLLPISAFALEFLLATPRIFLHWIRHPEVVYGSWLEFMKRIAEQ